MTDPAPEPSVERTDGGGSDTTSDGPSRGTETRVAQAERGEATDSDTETADIDPAALVRDGPILLFDGVCNLCNGTIAFVIRHDPAGRFRFAPLQSAVGKALLAYADVDVDPMESFVLIDGDDVYVKSEATLRTAKDLTLPWSLAGVFLYVPRIVRNAVYDIVANYRYQVFGRQDRCMVPDEDVSDRFLT